jgi:hypothetical protein
MSPEEFTRLRECVAWGCGLLATIFAIAAGAAHSGWLGAFTAAASGFAAMAATGAYANRPTPLVPRAPAS